jgi:hypothetical protein
MKTETRIYDDGTEPDVIRRYCCDGLCKQGRDCPGAPAPAEAATEVGADDGLEAVGGVVLLAVVIVLTVAAISLLAGYFS